ncbi:MAG: hypothetical protein R6W06_06545, partial [Prochlorococcaceae cyanobacterium]
AGDGLTNDAALTFSTLEAGASRVITVNGEEVENYSAPTEDGTYEVEVIDTDAAGNSGSASLTFTLDRTGPTFTTTAPQALTAGGTLLYDATTDDEGAGTVRYALKGDPADLTIDPTTGQVSLTTGELAVGQRYGFTVLATDAAGNVSEQAAAIEVIEGVLTGFVEGINGYDLDRSREGLQFKVVATPDLKASSGELLYRIRSVGHIAMGVAVRVGEGGVLALDLPEGFALSGPNAVELFDSGARDALTGQLVMGSKVAQFGAEALEATGRRLQLASELDRNGDGMLYARVRMTMQALSSTGYAKGETLASGDAADGLDLLIQGGDIANMNRFTFSARYIPGGEVTSSQEGSQGMALGTAVLENVNEFKRSKGLGGLVRSAADGTGVGGAQVGLRLRGSSKWIDANGTAAGAFMQTDADGWFLSEFQHSGRQATYQLGLVGSGGQFVAGSVREVVLGGGIHFATAELLA